MLAVQLGLIVFVVQRFAIESQDHFLILSSLASVGALIHWWLPVSHRLAFFNLLSVAAIALVLGWPNFGWVLGIGLGLIGICLSPIPWRFRVLLTIVAALFLTNLRLDQHEPFWPVIASMFMFRLIVLLFETRRDPRPPSPALTLAYFMPLQNVGFLFFPILDFKTWKECYQPELTWGRAQVGIGYLVRGLSHLFAYRIVKYFLLPSPHELGDWPHMALFLATNYALYLRVSGCFHIITGIFHLFGFAMPRTHDNYFLASSITDIWRRINIYWKDFLMKLFFFPVFFRLRRLGNRVAVSLAILWVFLATWFLHVYQVFWMTRTIPLRLYDACLWLGVGVLVIVNMQLELSRKRRPARAGDELSIADALSKASRIAGTFILVSLFWACWNTPQVLPSIRALGLTDTSSLKGMATVLAVVAGVIVAGAVLMMVRARLVRGRLLPIRVEPLHRAIAFCALLGIVLLLSTPTVTSMFSPRTAGMLAALRYQSVVPVEAAQIVQGYYEEISQVRTPPGAWLSLMEGRPYTAQMNHYEEMSRPSDDLLQRELIPNFKGVVDGSTVSINRFGMRDRLDRTQKKPEGGCRLALVGSSVVMGHSVNDDQTFPRLLEADLNQPAGGNKIEVLNFGTGRSYAIQRHVLMDRKVFSFEPDAIYWFAHQDEYFGSVSHIVGLVDKHLLPPFPGLDEIVARAGVTHQTSGALTRALLEPHAKELVACVYRDVVQECRRRGILPVWVYLPMPGVVEVSIKSDELVALARDAGFEVLNLSDWAEGHRPDEVQIAERDYHANVLGNQLIAAKLAARLRANPALLPPCAR